MSGGAPAWPPASKAQLLSLEDLRTSSGRRAANGCLVEGERLLAEALAAGLRPRLVAVAPALAGHPVVEASRAAGASVVLLAQRRAEQVSDREHAPGLLAHVPVPAPWDGSVKPRGAALLVALCGLQDPGNVGTLLRSARAFGAAACLHAPGTADPFGPKVVRASAGASLVVPVAPVELDALPALGQRLGLTLVAAVAPAASGSEVARAGAPAGGPSSAELPERCLLLLGHETRGVPGLPAAATASIAQEPGLDSLNVAVAGSILMSGWYRARLA